VRDLVTGREFTVQLPLLMEEPQPCQWTARVARKSPGAYWVMGEDDIERPTVCATGLGVGASMRLTWRTTARGNCQAREFRPEVVLCDIGLSGMDGFEVAAQPSRDDESLKDILLVALTGDTPPEDLLRVPQAGFAHHMAKPASLEETARDHGFPGRPQSRQKKEDGAGP